MRWHSCGALLGERATHRSLLQAELWLLLVLLAETRLIPYERAKGSFRTGSVAHRHAATSMATRMQAEAERSTDQSELKRTWAAEVCCPALMASRLRARKSLPGTWGREQRGTRVSNGREGAVGGLSAVYAAPGLGSSRAPSSSW
jgi:hypothetical protein